MYTFSSIASNTFTITKGSIPDGVAEKIKNITEMFQEISNAHRDLHLKEEDGTRLVIGTQIRPPTSSHVDERAIFGREKEKENIISVLNPLNGPEFMVLPIIGMGGLGKSTLAQLVYNDSKFLQLFDKRCWAYVSEDFDLVRLTTAIVESVSNGPCQFSELSKLQDILREKIRGLSFFLVLDDVWNEKRNLWECFRVGFLGAKFVRILTTTRNTSVAKIMQTTTPFQLGSLPEGNCWLLFKHFAFCNSETSDNANLHEIGRGIVEKCNGSPLAIKALGGILRYEMEEEKWREILETDISEINETGEVMLALRLSYQKLPQHIRPCFLYLSMFPKGTIFEKDNVIRLWMAQGYINGNTRSLKTLEEIGSEYLDELQGRSLVDHWYFLLHDLVHDLARSISHEAYQPILVNDQQCNGLCKVYHLCLTESNKLSDFFLESSNYWSIRTVVNECSIENFNFAVFSQIACVRALQSWSSSLPNTLPTLKHLRYLSLRHTQMEVLPETICLLYNLQTLDLSFFHLRELPENIKNLINLQFFQLSSINIHHLPDSIFLLRNLHTLLLTDCTRLKKLPRGIEQVTRLCILDLPKFPINMPSGIGKLPTLKQLNGHFAVKGHGMIGGLEELKDLNKLSGLLCISGLRNISDVEYSRNANLVSKPNLHKLILNFQEDHRILGWRDKELHLSLRSNKNARIENDENIQDVVLQSLQPHGNLTELVILNYRARIFPSWLLNPLLPKLTTLTINFCTEPNFLPPFGQLPYLRFLEISGSTGVRNVVDELSTYSLLTEYGSSKQPKEHSYQSLEVLSLRNMLNLMEWQALDGDFPHLKKLVIECCPKLWKIATIPQEVRELTFEQCPKLKLLTCQSVIRNLKINECGFREIKFQSVSETLKISNCVELISINWSDMGLNYVREVSFEYCQKLEVITIPVGILNLNIHECGFREIMFGSLCDNLKISNCVDLFSINWCDGSLNYVQVVTSECCSKLKLLFPVKDVLHSMTQRAEIYDCPRLNLGKGYVYQRGPTIDEELTLCGNGDQIQLSSISKIPLVENPFALFLKKEDFLELESLTCAPSVGVTCQHISVPSLVSVNICRCRKVISVTGLDNLNNLKILYISYCSELSNWNDRTLPLSLEFLQLKYCDKLSSLPFLSVQNHSSTLKVFMA
ncbi:putative disease resistance protein RGA3 [Carex rostrata]